MKVTNGRAGMWKCDFCGELPPSADVEKYGDGYCHVIAAQITDDDWEPQPCGPVNETAITTVGE